MDKDKKKPADPTIVYKYCQHHRIITENKPYHPERGFVEYEDKVDKCYLIFKHLMIDTTTSLYYCLYRFLYLNHDNPYLDDHLQTLREFAYYISDDKNGLVVTTFTDDEVKRSINKAIKKFELDASNSNFMDSVLFIKKRFLFGMNPETNSRYTHKEIMKIINMRRTVFTDELILEVVSNMIETLDEKITYQMVADELGSSIQTVRKKIPESAKDVIKSHNAYISQKKYAERIEDAMLWLTDNFVDKVSIKKLRDITQVRDYSLIKRIFNKHVNEKR